MLEINVFIQFCNIDVQNADKSLSVASIEDECLCEDEVDV